MKLKTTLLALAAFSTLNSQPSTFAQGSLTPPAGAPTPVMKSLDQIEARTPLSPGAQGVVYTNGGYVITQSGSYYLTGNITVGAGGTGINIQSPSVTVDLNGFTISGDSTNSYGLSSSEEFGGFCNRVFNGTIQNCKYGISVNGQFIVDSINVQNCTQTGIALYGAGSVLSRCTVQSCQMGIFGDANLTVTDCTVFGCTSSSAALGIAISSGAISRCRVSDISAPMAQGIVNENGSVSDCVVRKVSAPAAGQAQGIVAMQVQNCHLDNVFSSTGTATGIQANGRGTISNCRIGNIKGGGSRGIYTDFRLSIQNCEVDDVIGAGATATGIHCAASGNILSECVVTSITNTVAGQNCYGIYSAGGLVDRCAVTRAKSYGIYAANDATVSNSRVLSVKDTNSGTGIYVAGSGNRIENNSVTGCYKGFEMNANTAMVIRNHASGNTTGYVNLPAGFVISGYLSMSSSSNPFVNVEL